MKLMCSCVISYHWGHEPAHSFFLLHAIWDCGPGGCIWGWLTFPVNLNRYRIRHVTLYLHRKCYHHWQGIFSTEFQLRGRGWPWDWWWVFNSISFVDINNLTSHSNSWTQVRSWTQAQSWGLRPHGWQWSLGQAAKVTRSCGSGRWKCSSSEDVGNDSSQWSQRVTCQVSSKSSILLPNIYTHIER